VKGAVAVEVFEAIRTILAVRSYDDRPIPSEVLDRIVRAGQLTASASNAQPWHFILVQNKDTLRQLGSLIRSGPYIANAQAAVVVVTDKNAFGLSDGSRAIQDMLLAAWSEGVGGNWTGFAGGGLDPLKPVLGIPNQLDVIGVLPFGYPDRAIGKGKKNRKPLSEVAFRERWGQSY
jgi:nitroreductase